MNHDTLIRDNAHLVLSPEIVLAHEALLKWASEFEPDAWPSIRSIIRFARCYEVNAQELAAMCGIVSYRMTTRGKIVWCDGQRFPELVRRTSPDRLSRRVLRAYGWFCAVAALVERDRAQVH